MRSVIHSILFDMGNVLIPFDIQRGYDAYARLSGLDASSVAERIRASGLYGAYESGQIDTAVFHASFTSLLGFDLPLADFREVWNAIFLPEPATSEELLISLKQRYRLVLLSNTNELHFDWLRERYPLLQHFDAYTLSHEVKAMKPDERIFAAAVENARCRPEECFFTDDIQAYVDAARSFGIQAEQFTGETALRAHLTRYGITF